MLMKLLSSWWLLILWLAYPTLLVAAQDSPESMLLQRQAYLNAAGSLLQTYMQEQHTWNHYFTTIAPDQSAREQITPQQKYRGFLNHTLTQWRQLSAIPACQSSHFLYELALYSYAVAADFRLTFLYTKSSILESKKAVQLAEDRSRHYTAKGDAYFKEANMLAQSSGCVNSPTPAE